MKRGQIENDKDSERVGKKQQFFISWTSCQFGLQLRPPSASKMLVDFTQSISTADESITLFHTLVMIHHCCFPLQVQWVCRFSVTANQTKHNLPVFWFLWLHSIDSEPTCSSSSCSLIKNYYLNVEIFKEQMKDKIDKNEIYQKNEENIEH